MNKISFNPHMVTPTMLLLLVIACIWMTSAKSYAQAEIKNYPYRVSRLMNINGKTAVVANGQPYLMYGVQLRLDNFMGWDHSSTRWALAEEYFQKAADAGFKTVIVPVHSGYDRRYNPDESEEWEQLHDKSPLEEKRKRFSGLLR